MPIHRPGDPLDVLDVAAASLRLIGGILLLVAVLGMLSLIVEFSVEDFFNSTQPLVETLVRLVPYVLGGGAFLGVAYFVKRRRRWAAIVAICLTAMAALVSLIVLAALFVLMDRTRGFESPLMCIPLLLVALFTFALGQLTFHLTKTIAAIRYLDPRPYPRVGFEAIPSVRAAPMPPPPLSDQHQTN
jgi:peptidoglycan/LPS O-acetylase OafA/YrhL